MHFCLENPKVLVFSINKHIKKHYQKLGNHFLSEEVGPRNTMALAHMVKINLTDIGTTSGDKIPWPAKLNGKWPMHNQNIGAN